MRNEKHFRIIFSLLALVLSILACGEKNFSTLQVYSAERGPVENYYDIEDDKILTENVWVFKPDGTYKANINLDGEIKFLTGRYGGDDLNEHDFTFSLDTNDDGEFDERLWVTDGDFSVIEWRIEDEPYKFFQKTPFP